MYWVLPSFTKIVWVLLGFIGFDWVSPGFTGFYWVLLGFYLVLLGFVLFFGFVFWFLVKAPAVDGVGSDVALMDKEMADDWSDAIGRWPGAIARLSLDRSTSFSGSSLARHRRRPHFNTRTTDKPQMPKTNPQSHLVPTDFSSNQPTPLTTR